MANLRAGAARSCITPRIGCHICGYFNDRIATGIRDELYAKSLILENDGTGIAIVVCDLIHLVRADTDVAKERASQLAGIPSSNIFISATHTHYGPATAAAFGTPRDDVYMADAMLRAADSVKLAQDRLMEAEVGIASTAVAGETFNRRWHLKDGRVEADFRYFPTDRALWEGSYELQLARSAKAAVGMVGATIEAALTALRRLA